MRNTLSIFLFILTLSVVTFAQTKTNDAISSQIKSLKADKNLSLNYEKSQNFTKILGFGDDFGREQNKSSGLSSFSFGIAFNYSGNQLTAAPEVFTVTFWAKCGKQKFAAGHDLKVIVNGETLDLGDARYATKPSEKDMEYLNFVIPRESLKKIAAGNSAQMTMGAAKFTFSPAHLKLFRDMLAISNPSATV